MIKILMDRCKPYCFEDQGQDLMTDALDLDVNVIQGTASKTQNKIHGGDGFWDFSKLLSEISPIFMIKMASQAAALANTKVFTLVKVMEIEELQNSKVVDIVHEKDARQDGYIFGGRCFLI